MLASQQMERHGTGRASLDIGLVSLGLGKLSVCVVYQSVMLAGVRGLTKVANLHLCCVTADGSSLDMIGLPLVWELARV